jgi:hypothetical protein
MITVLQIRCQDTITCRGVSVTNKCRFWIWWLVLFDICITSTHSYKSLHISCVLSYSGSPSVFTSQLCVYSKSKSHCDWRPVSKSWCRAPSGAHGQIFIIVWQLRSCICGAPSLTRGRVCHLYMLLTLASEVFFGSESLGTREDILLSQIWDFPFRRLLWLTGSRWRYLNPSASIHECTVLYLLGVLSRGHRVEEFVPPLPWKRLSTLLKRRLFMQWIHVSQYD